MNEKVIEQVRKRIAVIGGEGPANNSCLSKKDIHQILSIPEILIKDPDQSLPKILLGYSKPGTGGGLLSADLLLKEHLVKVLPKEMK